MFIGHFALAFAGKRVAPRASLGVLFAGAQLADLLWPVLVALGIEQVRIDPGNTAFTPLDFVAYPYSHSLVCLAVWAAGVGLLYRLRTGDRDAARVLIALVVSHWFLDVLTHRPDMPLYPGSVKVGLGLWNSVPATLGIELTLYGFGIWAYVRATRARDPVGRWAFWSLVAFLVLVYFSSLFGPPPPSVRALCVTAITGAVLLVCWGWWADRHREAVH